MEHVSCLVIRFAGSKDISLFRIALLFVPLRKSGHKFGVLRFKVLVRQSFRA